MANKPLEPKQRRFVDEYLVDLNATQAAIRAGYSRRTAEQIGYENLRKPVIAAAVEAAQAARAERLGVSQDYVVDNLTEIVERCMQRAPVMARDAKGMAQTTDAEGRHVWQFDARGALGGLNLLGKHLGMFAERVEHSGPNGGPVAVQVWRFGNKTVAF
jgi:phage terminase small subunit